MQIFATSTPYLKVLYIKFLVGKLAIEAQDMLALQNKEIFDFLIYE